MTTFRYTVKLYRNPKERDAGSPFFTASGPSVGTTTEERRIHARNMAYAATKHFPCWRTVEHSIMRSNT